MKGALSEILQICAAASARSSWRVGAIALAVAALAAAPLAIYPIFVMNWMCFAMLAASFDLLLGSVGLLSFGHAAFFGIGAYTFAQAAKSFAIDPLLGVVLSAALAAVAGAGMGFLAIRRKGIEFSMITLALSQMIAFLALQAPFTGGEDGIQEVPRGRVFGAFDLNDASHIYVFALVVFLAVAAFLWRVRKSPFGHILNAIREHPNRATSLGYDVSEFRLKAFVLSTAVAGAAGALHALIFQFATLSDIDFQLSGTVILMSLLGGIGVFLGPFVGAGVVVTLQSALATSEFPIKIAIGAVFIICVLAMRRGIVGEIVARYSN